MVGRLASKKAKAGEVVSGVLVKRGFNYHIVSAEELQHYTDLSQGVVLQKQTLPFTAPFSLLHHCLLQLAGGVEQVEQSGKNCLRVFDSVSNNNLELSAFNVYISSLIYLSSLIYNYISSLI